MSELISLKCSSCGGNLEAPADQMEMRSQSAVLRPGTILKCPHCQTEHAAGTELPRQMTVNNSGGINFTAGGNITVNVGRDIITGDQHAPVRRQRPFAAEFRNVLSEHFSMEEIEDLCFNFGIKADNLDGRNASSKARHLIQYAQRREVLRDLLALCKELRPELDWPEYREPPRRTRPKSNPKPKQTPQAQTGPKTDTAAPPTAQQPKPEPPPQPQETETDTSVSAKIKSWLQKLGGG